MSLIHDIQAAAISQSTDVPQLLRMCKLLAARISHQQFGEWVDQELNGYSSVESLPDYRVAIVNSYGSFIGTFARADRLQIPTSVLPKDLQNHFRHAYLSSSISAYVTLVESENSTGVLHEDWPVGLALHHASKIMQEMQCVSAWKEIPMGAIARLLDSVKTRVLGFAIDLEREAPNAGDTPIGSQPPLSTEKMTQIFNTNITGNVGNLANASEHFTQTASVQPGNWDSLENHLLSLGLQPIDLEGMRNELDHVSSSTEVTEKSAVASNWIGRLTGKVMAGVSGASIEAAAAGIAKAIGAYLGIPVL